MTIKIETFFGTFDCKLSVNKYTNNGNTAIQIFSKNEEFDFWEPFAMLTVNLDKKLDEGYAYLDINSFREAEAFVIKNNLGEFAEDYGFSGFCVYPLFKLNMEEIQKYAE